MSVEPENFSNSEWVDYNTYWTNIAVLAVLGGILILVGMAWSQQGLSTAIQDTASGVVIVEGGMTDGVFKGSFMASIGILLLSLIPHQVRKAQSIKKYRKGNTVMRRAS